MKSGNLNFLEPSGPLQVCNGTALPLLRICCDADGASSHFLKDEQVFSLGWFTCSTYVSW